MSKSLNDLKIHRDAMRLAEVAWEMVARWDYLAKDTVGKQLVRSQDSMATDQAEGHDGSLFKENQKLCYYASCSLTEAQTWIEKSITFSLLTLSLSEIYTASSKRFATV